MKRLFVILLAFVLSQQIVKAQISFDPGEGCLNVVDFTAGKDFGESGRIILQICIRRKLGLGEGSQFLVVTDNENILLKPVKEPSLDEFYSLIEQAQKTAAQLGLTEDEINAEIKAMRAEKRK